jgi:hypothetical protein
MLPEISPLSFGTQLEKSPEKIHKKAIPIEEEADQDQMRALFAFKIFS